MKIMLRGKGNVFEQIAEEYIRLISLNIIEPNEKLPSCRQLAKELGINPNTVEKAYSLLEEKGYIITIPKKGAYVIDKENNVEDSIIEDVIKQVQLFKDSNISYEKMIDIVNNVYGEDKK